MAPQGASSSRGFCGINDCLKVGEAEQESAKRRHLHRVKEDEDYYDWSGAKTRTGAPPSLWTILQSPEQRNVVLLATAFYAFSLVCYTVLANALVYVTFHWVPELSPSSPGDFTSDVHGNRTLVLQRYANPDDWHYRRELYDVGFQVTPNRSDRPWWLKAAFVDSMVMISQFIAPAVLLLFGHTQNYVCYVALIGVQGILKGVTQILTVLPAANKGEYCWMVNFGPQELDVVLHDQFSRWFYKSWGTGHGCDDMLWSGHTSQSCIGVLFVNNALRTQNVPRCIRMLLALYFLVYVIAVLSCRMHYSIDVFVATIVACLMYTHSQLRYWLWWVANTLVCNPYKSPSSGKQDDHVPLAGHREADHPEDEVVATSSTQALLCCAVTAHREGLNSGIRSW